MRVTYIRLENVAGIYVGSGREVLEISFEKSINKIICISAENGVGKTVFLSSISPFTGVTPIDDRSTLSYILPNKNGYKEIHYQDNDDQYIIKHYYKAAKDGKHTIKSYFAMNGNELNDNGNVTSFLSLVEIHMGLTIDMLRLSRLGSNVNSFVTLSPAKRKEYIGKLIEEIELYLTIYKKINGDIRLVKVLMRANDNNLNNCHISDLVIEEENLNKARKELRSKEKDKDVVLKKIGKIQSIERDNNIDELKRKLHESETSLLELEKIHDAIIELSLENISVDELIKQRNDIMNKRIDIQSNINSFKMNIDTALMNIDRLQTSIKRVVSNNDIESLKCAIDNIKLYLSNVNSYIKDMEYRCSSDDIYDIIHHLSSFNQIGQMIYTFGSTPISIYMKLRTNGKSVDKFLKDQIHRNISRLNDNDIKRLLSQIFSDDQIITPNCDTEFNDCPYYRLSEIIDDIKNKIEDDIYDDETLRYIQIISNNIDNILNEIDNILSKNIPDKLKEDLKEKNIFNRLKNKLILFDLSDMQKYLSIVKEYEIYIDNMRKLQEYEHLLSVYKNSGIDNQLEEIQQLKQSIDSYNEHIGSLEDELVDINKLLNEIDKQIGLVSRYNDGKKYQKIFISNIESINKTLIPLQSSSEEKKELEFSLRELNNVINLIREDIKIKENKISEYNRLLREEKLLSKKYKELNMILEATSTKKGIPLTYMKKHLGRIQRLSNDLLSIIYGDTLQLGKFKVTEETFEVPYIKNSKRIPDVKYASQSEVALITMALSFALNQSSGNYNILLLDEIDAGLDQENRSAFLKMLYQQMNILNSEQVFIISHNLQSMVNIPMDCIKLSDIETSQLQNVIYE